MPHERLVHARGRQDPSQDRSVLTAHHTYRKGDHVMHTQSTLVRIGVLAVLFALGEPGQCGAARCGQVLCGDQTIGCH